MCDIAGAGGPWATSPAAGAEGGGLHAVLAGGGAEPAGAVARGVDVHAVAVRCRAHAQPVVELAAEADRPAGRAAGHPVGRHLASGAVEVQVPRLAVVPVQVRPGV